MFNKQPGNAGVLSRIPLIGRRKGKGRSSPFATPQDLHHQVSDARERMAWQDDPALLNALTPAEIQERQTVHQEIRAAELEEYRQTKISRIQLLQQQRGLDTKLRQQENSDLLWLRRASSEARRLSDIAARTAQLYKSYRFQIAALMGTALVGVVWGAVNVQQGVARQQGLEWGQLAWFLAYGIEPLVTIPLIVLLKHQSDMSDWHRQTTWREQWPLRCVEAALLGVTVALNVVPHRHEGLGAAIYAIPPLMIATSMILLPIVSRQLGELLQEARTAILAAENQQTAATDADRSAADADQSTGQDEAAVDPVGNDGATTPEPAGPMPSGGLVGIDADRSTWTLAGQPTTSIPAVSTRSASTDQHPDREANSQVTARSAPGQHTEHTPVSTSPDASPEPNAPSGPDRPESTDSSVPTARTATGQHPVGVDVDQSGPVPTGQLERPAEQTAVIDDDAIVVEFLEPIAQRLLSEDDWVSRADVMNLLGAGASRASRLLVKLNERHPERPDPRPKRRPERDIEIDEMIKALTAPVAATR